MRNRILTPLVLILAAVGSLAAAQRDPFLPTVTLDPTGPQEGLLTIAFAVPDGYSLYADTISVEVVNDRAQLTPKDIPRGKMKQDIFSDPPEQRETYLHDFALKYAVRVETGRRFEVVVSYQGCSESLCFLPATRTFTLTLPGETGAGKDASATTTQAKDARTTATATVAAAGDWMERIGGFAIVGTEAGFIGPKAFIAFLDRAESGAGAAPHGWAARIENAGPILLILLTLAGGLLLNLTPCVLPLIPINVAVIGAGARAGSRARGFALGGAYGAGIALAYGILGLAVVAGGGKFGTLNSAPWFNFAVAVVFAILALAMFGVFNVDLARLRSGRGPRNSWRGSFLLAGFMGAVAALLAGACVAPVVLAVLLFARNLYATGHAGAALLPFLLGVGMALPWPFAGAGLSFLPKPGKWMTWVKVGFGAFILAMALYYGRVGVNLLRQRASGEEAAEVAAVQRRRIEEGGWLDSLSEALRISKERNKPVLIDFWATWCKNCLAMDEVTFRDPTVRKRIESFVKVKVQLEDFTDPNVREIQQHFDIVGLPTYMVLRP